MFKLKKKKKGVQKRNFSINYKMYVLKKSKNNLQMHTKIKILIKNVMKKILHACFNYTIPKKEFS